MGNCCISPTDDHLKMPDGKRPPQPYLYPNPNPHLLSDHMTAPMFPQDMIDSVYILKEETLPDHMADREDLSNKEGTMFLEKSKHVMETMRNGRPRSLSDRKRHSSARLSRTGHSSPVFIKKANSCSTIYTDDSTVSQPNLKSTLKCVSLAIYYHIKNRDRNREPRTLPIFDEKRHPLTREEVPSHYADYTPDHKVIYKFVKTLFHAAQLTAECGIIALIYLERLVHYAELDLHPSNWKRIVLGSILLASKVWDDQAVWNEDYCQILRDTTVEDLNEMERVFLDQLQFNTNVPASMYAKYYFDLRSLAEDNGLVFPNEYEPLTKERAKKLECEDFTDLLKTANLHKEILQKAISSISEEKLLHPFQLRKSASTEALSPKNVAILM